MQIKRSKCCSRSHGLYGIRSGSAALVRILVNASACSSGQFDTFLCVAGTQTRDVKTPEIYDELAWLALSSVLAHSLHGECTMCGIENADGPF